MHSIERYLDGRPAESATERVVQDAFAGHPGMDSDLLRECVDRWHQVPADVTDRFVPAELRGLTRDRPVDDALLARLVERTVRRAPTPSAPTTWTLRPQLVLQPIEVLGGALPAGATITGTVPGGIDGEPVAVLGSTFTLTGSGFSPMPGQNLVVIHELHGGVVTKTFTSTPTAVSATALECVAPLPGTTPPGLHRIEVAIAGHRTSNCLNIWLTEPPAPPATLLTVTPGAQYPDKKIMLTVQGLHANPSVWWRSSSQNGPDPALHCPAVAVGATQVECVLPIALVRNPGQYWVAVSGSGQKLSNWAPVTVCAYRYQVSFEQILCIDESDPEWWGDDEVVTRWVIAADEHGWSKGTGEYSGFSDGTLQYYLGSDRDVYLPDDGPGTVQTRLAVGTLLLEWDAGDAEQWNTILDAAGSAASAIPTAGPIVSAVLKVLGKLIALLGGDPDVLGTHVDEWTAEDLLAQTGPTGTLVHSMDFLNDDGTGSYRLRCTISREPV
jgi:hypothetical protein